LLDAAVGLRLLGSAAEVHATQLGDDQFEMLK
jgi:hypothetical protein